MKNVILSQFIIVNDSLFAWKRKMFFFILSIVFIAFDYLQNKDCVSFFFLKYLNYCLPYFICIITSLS